MPELPEVETITNALRPHLINKNLVSIIPRTEMLRYPLDIGDYPALVESQIKSVRRRAKFIVIELSCSFSILIHLGMTGSIRIENSGGKLIRHDHLILKLDDDKSMIFNDPRKFGSVKVYKIEQSGQFPEILKPLPPEPLDDSFNNDYLLPIVKGRSKAIKSVLMDNKLVTGVGNIYACEALFLAGINPMKSSSKLSKKQCQNLINSIKTVLTDSIKLGGTTISDYKKVDGSEGKYSLKLKVYGKERESCVNKCGSTIKRIKTCGRSTYYCTHCQR